MIDALLGAGLTSVRCTFKYPPFVNRQAPTSPDQVFVWFACNFLTGRRRPPGRSPIPQTPPTPVVTVLRLVEIDTHRSRGRGREGRKHPFQRPRGQFLVYERRCPGGCDVHPRRAQVMFPAGTGRMLRRYGPPQLPVDFFPYHLAGLVERCR
jgi:hypothetical protein